MKQGPQPMQIFDVAERCAKLRQPTPPPRRKKTPPKPADPSVVYVFIWSKLDRMGHRCRMTARGKLNSGRLEFEDGHTIITSRNYIRRLNC